MIIRNVRLIDNPQQPVDVMINSNIIQSISPAEPANKNDFNGNGLYIVPGFTDLHVHGAGGADFSCGDEAGVMMADISLARMGTTSYLATTFYLPKGSNSHLDLLRELYRSGRCPGMKGIHLEGPFISPAKKGGIAENKICPYSEKVLDDVFLHCGEALKMMTIAPETDHTDTLISTLKKHGVIPAFGHSDATAEQTRLAIKHGINHVTHICNAMRPIHHREPGPLPEIFDSKATVQIIADGVHISERMVRFLHNMVGTDRCVCITDGMLSSGLPDGEYVYQGYPFYAKNGEARYIHNDGLIGTSLGVARIAERFMSYTNCSFRNALKTITDNPLRVIKSSRDYPKIREGNPADLVLTDESFQIKTVWKNGVMLSPE